MARAPHQTSPAAPTLACQPVRHAHLPPRPAAQHQNFLRLLQAEQEESDSAPPGAWTPWRPPEVLPIPYWTIRAQRPRLDLPRQQPARRSNSQGLKPDSSTTVQSPDSTPDSDPHRPSATTTATTHRQDPTPTRRRRCRHHHLPGGQSLIRRLAATDAKPAAAQPHPAHHQDGLPLCLLNLLVLGHARCCLQPVVHPSLHQDAALLPDAERLPAVGHSEVIAGLRLGLHRSARPGPVCCCRGAG